VGLGGRNRKAASASERARQSIGKTIKSVLDRIAQSDSALGSIFAQCIKTGTFCSYQPEPDFPIAWEFAAPNAGSTIEPAEVHQPPAAIVLQRVPNRLPIMRMPRRRWYSKYLPSRSPNGLFLWTGKSNDARFAPRLIARRAATARWL
jgi:hypothetical protein